MTTEFASDTTGMMSWEAFNKAVSDAVVNGVAAAARQEQEQRQQQNGIGG